MLSHIYLSNFAIIEKLDLELKAGMTALTGETGAGKSILVDAIGLVLGDRAESSVVRHGADKTEITLTIEIEETPSAKQWLIDQDLIETDESQCILRRVITSKGQSRAWINGSPCNLGMLQQLGEQLVDIHGQHEHQSLMKKGMQRQMLDDYAENESLLLTISNKYQRWKELSNKLQQLSNENSNHQAKLDLLRFQTQELSELQLSPDEATQLDTEHATLSNAEQLIRSTSQSVIQLYDAEEQSIYSSISDVLSKMESSCELDPKLREPLEMLQNAQIQIQEATDALRQYHESTNLDPERLEWVNNRLSTLHDLSRKHQTTPDKLYDTWQKLVTDLEELDSDDYNLEALQERLDEYENDYLQVTRKLTRSREKASLLLSKGVTKAMQTLGMEGGVFSIAIQKMEAFSEHGMDKIEFQVSANPGQPLKSLIKVASGGELSRISLAIQMIAAQRITLPALIFDEVDSGIGGSIAEVVGKQLRNLGSNRQVLCVTHLPQVASQAHNHYKVTKIKNTDSTSTGMLILNQTDRVHEIARMMGGIDITDSTLNLAKEMLQNQSPI